MTEEQRINQARETIIGIFRAYEIETGAVISDEKYDHVRWLLWKAEGEQCEDCGKPLRSGDAVYKKCSDCHDINSKW